MDNHYKETMTMPNRDFPMKVLQFNHFGIGKPCIVSHWHNEIELLFITEGSGEFQVGSHSFIGNAGDLIVVNCNEMHSLENRSDELAYDCIILDPHILNSRFLDLCDAKYISPIIDNRILFTHHIIENKAIDVCISRLTHEYAVKDVGYELAIKSALFDLIVTLLRYHISEILTDTQMKHRRKAMAFFNETISYILENYNIDLTIDKLSQRVHISKYHFCRSFKQMTGHTVNHFINTIRLKEADYLLKESDLSVSEIAYAVGYNDSSYFSRIYKQFRNCRPSDIRGKPS